MQFIGIEIAPAATKAVVLCIDPSETLPDACVSHSWIDGLPPGYHSLYRDRMARQQYLIDILHPAGFI